MPFGEFVHLHMQYYSFANSILKCAAFQFFTPARKSTINFYLKVYGENEWKSHPYFTKQIIYSLPIREYEDSELDKQIIKVATELAHKYEYVKDVQLEKLVMKKYGLSETESNMVYGEMNRLPDLSAINNMKVEVEANV